MQFFNRSQIEISNQAQAVDRKDKDDRRSILRKMLAGSAAFAMGLFASSRAWATCNCSTSCTPTCSNCCFKWVVMCWNLDIDDYVFQFDIWEGTPHGSCCSDAQYPVCTLQCSPDYPC